MKKIVIVGLGPGGMGQVTAAAWKALQQGRPLYFRTGSHAVARRLTRLGIPVRTFDHLFDQEGSFEEIDRAIALRLISAAVRKHTVCYAVSGHPATGDAPVKQLFRLASRYGVALQIIRESVSLNRCWPPCRLICPAGLRLWMPLSLIPCR